MRHDRALFIFSLSDAGDAMSSRPKLPPHGTAERYRIERKAGQTCEKCRAHMASVRKEQRSNRTAVAARAKLHLVPEPADDTRDDTTPAPARPRTRKSTAGAKRAVGTMQAAVEADLAEIDEKLRVPFHASLSALAVELAQEIDEPATLPTTRRDARKQLFDVLRSLRTPKEGGDDSALTLILEQAGFGTPVVPRRSS